MARYIYIYIIASSLLSFFFLSYIVSRYSTIAIGKKIREFREGKSGRGGVLPLCCNATREIYNTVLGKREMEGEGMGEEEEER